MCFCTKKKKDLDNRGWYFLPLSVTTSHLTHPTSVKLLYSFPLVTDSLTNQALFSNETAAAVLPDPSLQMCNRSLMFATQRRPLLLTKLYPPSSTLQISLYLFIWSTKQHTLGAVSWTWLFDLSAETSETSCVIIDTVSFWLCLLCLVQWFDRNKLQVMQINDTQFLLNASPQTQHNRSCITIWSMGLLQNHWSVTVTPGPVLFPVNNAAEFFILHWCNALEQLSDTHQVVHY